MGQSIEDRAQRARDAGDALSEASTLLARLDLSGQLFGGDAPGRLGDLGRALHGRWAEARTAREREAAVHSARLRDLASTLRAVAANYRDAEDTARARHRAMEA